jgi:4,5-dihydroxyphthalate decarboxylase
MSKIRMTVACGAYDYLQPLREGKVQAEGIDLNLITVDCGTRHQRMSDYHEYDACEFSMGTYLVARAQGVDSLQAIPFFTRRMFFHRFCFVRAESGIESPRALKGRKIGLLTYQNSLAIFVKAMLMHSYDLAVTDVTWVTMGKERVDTKLPPGIKLERAEPGKSMEELLLTGAIDVMVEPDLPQAWLDGDGTVARLFPDYEKEERDYYARTRLFPIMHPLVAKKEILDRNPWVATSLYDAFMESRRLYNGFMRQPHRLSFAWPAVEQERHFFGKDPFYQGFTENRHDVERMIQFAREQGMLAQAITAEEIFAANTLRT